METDWWLELERSYTSRIAQRRKLFADHGKLVLDYLPGSELGCKEIMEHALQFYCDRYPQYFTLSYSPSEGHIFHNRILKNETVISNMHPLHVLLQNVPEDFAVMLRNSEDGCYYFRAGVLCSALGWNVEMKLGMQLKEIHSPIPDYKEKMEFSMDRLVIFLSSPFSSTSIIAPFPPLSNPDEFFKNNCKTPSINFIPSSATSPNCPLHGLSSAVPGVSKSILRSSCHPTILTKPTVYRSPPLSPSHAFTCASTGKPCVASRSPAPSSSTSKRCSPRLRISATKPIFRPCCSRSSRRARRA